MTLDISEINNINKYDKNYVIIKRLFREQQSRIEFMNYHCMIGLPGFDYVRLRQLGLCAEEIKRNNVKGALAECGVFRGTFSVALNALFPERKLYLYDTFEGFIEKDIYEEKDPQFTMQRPWYSYINEYSSSSDLINEVKNILPNPHNAIFRKGYFPETAAYDLDERFAFVSIDLDIYRPTLEALRFFYPRLEKGGYMFIHDGKYTGVLDALIEYKAEYPEHICYIPICDPSESWILIK